MVAESSLQGRCEEEKSWFMKNFQDSAWHRLACFIDVSHIKKTQAQGLDTVDPQRGLLNIRLISSVFPYPQGHGVFYSAPFFLFICFETDSILAILRNILF